MYGLTLTVFSGRALIRCPTVTMNLWIFHPFFNQPLKKSLEVSCKSFTMPTTVHYISDLVPWIQDSNKMNYKAFRAQLCLYKLHTWAPHSQRPQVRRWLYWRTLNSGLLFVPLDAKNLEAVWGVQACKDFLHCVWLPCFFTISWLLTLDFAIFFREFL